MIPLRPPNRMTSSPFQAPPLKTGVSHTGSTTPVAASTRRRVRPSPNPTNRLSGDQNSGVPARAVSDTWRASPDAREWSRIRDRPVSSPSR